MHNYKISKNIPLPDPFVPSSLGGLLKYPWPYMEAGDSFAVPASDRKDAMSKGTTAQSSGISWCKRNRPNYTIRYRSYSDHARVWMVKKS